MRSPIFAVLGLTTTFLFAACGDDNKGGRPIGDGTGGSSTGGKGSGGSGTGGKGGGTGGAKPGPDGGDGGGGGSDAGPGGTGGATGTGGGGTAGDGGIIVFPPIEAGPPPDAGTPAPRDCAPTGNATVSADPCTAFAEANCKRLDTCTSFSLKTSFGDVDSCIAVYKSACAASYGGAGQKTTLAQVHDCAAEWINAPCGCVLGEVCAELAPSPGNSANGTSCSDGRQCSGGVCDAATLTTCGKCKEGGGVDEVCGARAPCRAGLSCNSQNVCAAPRQRGQHCDSSRDCLDGLGCTAGKCGELRGVGDDCAGDALSCNTYKGIFCVSGKCVQFDVNETIGTGDAAKCGGSGNPEDPTVTLCSASAVCVSGHCKARGGDGDVCNPTDACLPELTCDATNNHCKATVTPTCEP